MRVIDRGKNPPASNMAFDLELLKNVGKEGESILHLYDWQGDCATYGHFIIPENFFNLPEVQKRGLKIAKRPTGGGIIFHLCDFTFSVLIPASHSAYSMNTLENYLYVNEKVKEGINEFLDSNSVSELLPYCQETSIQGVERYCMAHPTKYDLMYHGKKIGGAAQRKTKDGFLHQGSIFLGSLSQDYLSAVLKNGKIISNVMKTQSWPLVGDQPSQVELENAKNKLKELIILKFS